MSAPKRRLDFVFQCRQSFDQLTGEDAIVRRCAECKTDVTDLDALDDAELDLFLAAADRAGLELCARLTVRAEPRPCTEHLKPGTYLGRTEANTRRTGRFGVRPGETINDAIARCTAQATADQAEVDALLDRARRRTR